MFLWVVRNNFKQFHMFQILFVTDKVGSHIETCIKNEKTIMILFLKLHSFSKCFNSNFIISFNDVPYFSQFFHMTIHMQSKTAANNGVSCRITINTNYTNQ